MRLVRLKPGSYHHPLKLPRILPFLQLHRSETATYPTVKIPEKYAEFLNSEIRNPAPQVHIQLFNGLALAVTSAKPIVGSAKIRLKYLLEYQIGTLTDHAIHYNGYA
jgi:hypothetical protein